MKKNLIVFSVLLFFTLTTIAQAYLPNALTTIKLFPVKKEAKWGFINSSGELIIDTEFDYCHPFKEGMALVERDDDIWFIDEQGKKAFESPFSMSWIVSEGMIRIILDDKVGYINKKGEIIIEPSFKQGGDFTEGYAWVRTIDTDKVGFISKNGKMAITAVFEYAGDFKGGYAPVRLDGKWGYIDRNGKLFKNLIYTLANNFSEGIAPTWKYGPDLKYINKKGEELFRHRIYEPSQLPKGSWKVPVWGFHESRIKAKNTNGLIGYLNDKGEVEVDFQYSDGGNFSNGLARIKSGSKWGYINRKGKVKISAHFDYAEDFNNNIAAVYQGGSKEQFEEKSQQVKLGYINQKGELIWPYSN